MVIYTLYVKTHLKTGLKYMGYTKLNPYIYRGSGKYWKRHINIHGEDDIWTNVIFQTEIKDEIKPMGLYYSNLWNVVESDEWANLKPENGDGGWFLTPQVIEKRATIPHIDIINPSHKRKYGINRK